MTTSVSEVQCIPVQAGGAESESSLVSTFILKDDSLQDAISMDDTGLNELEIPNYPSMSPESFEESEYIAEWEQDVSDPLEMLMISKDSEEASRPKLENNNYYDKKEQCSKKMYRSRGKQSYRNMHRPFRSRPGGSFHNNYGSEFKSWKEGNNFHLSGVSYGANSSRVLDGANSSKVSNGTRNSSFIHQRSGGPWSNPDRLSPTPSDSASQMGHTSSVSLKSDVDGVSVISLVQTLSELDNFSASLLTLLDKYNFDHREVKRIIDKNINTFELNGETVSLKPKFQICKSYLGNEGCNDGIKCLDLHICPKFINETCNSKSCVMGHFWKTNHNLEILKAFSVASLQLPTLHKLFSSFSLDDCHVANDLQICSEYNLGKCKKSDCNSLHLCISFLAKVCDSSDKCQLYHNPLQKDVSSVLLHHGLSINESPRDILQSITASPCVKQEIDKFKASGSSPLGKTDSGDSFVSTGAISKNKSNSSQISQNHNDNSQGKDRVLKTTWSYHFLGEVKVAEICYYSVENYCKFEDSGCTRLHCTRHFHWQVREKGKPWVNLRDFQVLSLEKGFCDPQVSQVDVPPLDPLKIDPLVKGLLATMQGRSQWRADFDKMLLVLAKSDSQPGSSTSSNQQPNMLDLRRLCSEYIPNKVPEACVFAWYFLDKNKKWVEYGQVDSTGDKKLICNITSSDIEKHRRQRPNSPLPFLSSRFNYFLDTMALKQVNLDTNVTRNARRRPRPYLKREKLSFKKMQFL